MKFKIVGDSCTDFTSEDMKKEYMVSVPLTIDVGGFEVVDDEKFDQADFLKRVAEYEGCPKSACPSPESYIQSFADASEIFVVTLSSQLSGSYNSAELAKNMYMEEHPEVKIQVFDSKSASSGQFLLVHLIEKLALEGRGFEEIVDKVTAVRDEMETVFVLETLDTLRKNGRLTGVKALVATALNIKPYMKAVDGSIAQAGQARGMKKALDKMAEYIGEIGKNLSEKTVVIAHCNCAERAKHLGEKLMEQYHFKEIAIVETRGISSMYANDGGVVVAF
ncbi:MAG: DegV family protein [Lachnospiraceae bacterium]|nr:DegV family protein [Lachnospiraceae bacterium]